jgi:uncharacterized membrane protein
MAARRLMLGGALAVLAFFMAAPGARANINFCNKFAYKIFIAIAYPQGDDRWLSRGWMSLDTGECGAFDNALRVSTFYYRVESVGYRNSAGHNIKTTWGSGGRQFAIWENDNFNYWDAQKRVLNSTLADFSLSTDSIPDGADVTVTIGPDVAARTDVTTPQK